MLTPREARHILVVEDEAVVAMELQRTLRHMGYEVPATAASGDEAVQLASERCPDLVLMDIRIAGARDGIETAATLRERFGLPVVFLTAYADDETLARAKRTEPLGYLVKPVRDDELRSAIEVALYRKEMENRLRVREHWFSATLQAIGDAVVATDPAGEITFMNLAAEALVGVRREEAVGRKLADVLHLVDEQSMAPRENPLARAIAEGRVVGLEPGTALRTPGGARPIEDSAAPIVGDRGELLGAVMVFRDVSRQRRLQHELALADRLASLGTLAAGVAHEVNTPLAVVVSTADHVAGELRAIGEQLRSGAVLPAAELGSRLGRLEESLRDLGAGAARVSRIVGDLREFAVPREDAGGNVDLHQVVDWALRMTASQIERRASVTRELGPVPPVHARHARLGQVLVNLVINAAQAMPEGRRDRNGIFVTTSTDANGNAVIGVRDTGSGMTPEVAARVFEPFFTTRDVGKGAGLGLSVCHGIVKALGGEISVKSAPGAGSTFTVVLPPAPASAVPVPAPEPARPERSRLRGRVLVVDDEPALLRTIVRTLSEHEAVGCASSAEALALLDGPGDFDVVISDLMMPGMTGMELYEHVLARSPDLAARMVFLTGGAFTQRASDFLASVPNVCLEKPFVPSGLREIVQDLVRRRRGGL